MKKISDFSKVERILSVISVIWILVWFVVAVNESRGYFDEEFITIFFIYGLLPVLVVVGWKWVQGAAIKKN